MGREESKTTGKGLGKRLPEEPPLDRADLLVPGE